MNLRTFVPENAGLLILQVGVQKRSCGEIFLLSCFVFQRSTVLSFETKASGFHVGCAMRLTTRMPSSESLKGICRAEARLYLAEQNLNNSDMEWPECPTCINSSMNALVVQW